MNTSAAFARCSADTRADRRALRSTNWSARAPPATPRSVKIVFDPRQISYGEILRIGFSVATDPTRLNEQFPDERPAMPGRHLLSRWRPAGGRRTLCRPVAGRPRIPPPDRHPPRPLQGFLPPPILPPGLSASAPRRRLHRHLRPTQGGGAEEPVSGRLSARPAQVTVGATSISSRLANDLIQVALIGAVARFWLGVDLPSMSWRRR